MDDLLDAFARLEARLENLERRVAAIEHRPDAVPIPPMEAPGPATETPAIDAYALPQAGGIFPVLGKALLGIAGAYVLRAVAESGSFPKVAVVALALAYAGTWLVWAARVRSGPRFTGTVYAATAGAILAPMLGELTLRLQVLSSLVTAGLLSVFVLAAYALAWKRNLAPVVGVAQVTAVITALVLLIASHDLVPYIAALLVIALASEVAAACNRWLGLRFLAAPAVDIAVWILVYIYSLPGTSRLEYPSVGVTTLLALPSLLFLIYGISVVFRTAWLRLRITRFEIIQPIVAFLPAALAWVWFAPGTGSAALGAFCWLLSAACYAAAFACFDRTAEQRNYHVYATWGAGLILAGSFLLLSPLLLGLFLSVAAIAVTLLGARLARLTLEFHGLLYLAAAAFASGLLEYAGRALAGTFPAAPGWNAWIVAVSALFCYAIGGQLQGERWNQRLLRLLSAILAVSAIATFLVSGLFWLAATGMSPGALSCRRHSHAYHLCAGAGVGLRRLSLAAR